MLIKLPGIVLVMTAFILLGAKMSDKLKKRKDSLEEMIRAFTLFETEVDFSINRAEEAFSNISKALGDNKIFWDVSKNIKECGVGKAWCDAVDCHADKMCLKREDKDILLSFSEGLGKVDRINQIKSIRYTVSLLQGVYKDAQEEYTVLARLYRSLSLAIGAMIVLLII